MTPDQLTFSLQARHRTIDPFPSTPGIQGKFVLQYDDFMTETYESSGTSTSIGGYLPFGAAGGSGSWGQAGNSTFGIGAGASGYNVYFDTRARPPVCRAFVQAQLTAATVGASIGFINGTDYILATINGSGDWALTTNVNGTGASYNSSISAAAPYEFRIVLVYPEAWLYANTPQGWIPVGFVSLGGVYSGDDLRIASNWASWVPVFGGNLGDNVDVYYDYVQVGIPGAYGCRDFKPVVYKDGTPYQKDGRYYFTMTCANGSDFATNDQSICSVNPDTGDVRMESKLFYNVTVSSTNYTTALYGGQVVVDDTTSPTTYYCFPNSWGLYGVAQGVDEWLAVTQKNITQGVHVLNATMLTLPNSVSHSHYDGSVRWDQSTGLWRMTCIETAQRTNWTGNYATTYTSPDLNTWAEGTPYSTDSSLKIDGSCWFRMSGVWYVAAGGNDHFHVYLYNATNGTLAPISNLSTLQTNYENFQGVPVLFSVFVPHLCMIPVFNDGNTQWIYLTYDCTFLNPPSGSGGPGTGGALVVMQATTQQSGNEFSLHTGNPLRIGSF